MALSPYGGDSPLGGGLSSPQGRGTVPIGTVVGQCSAPLSSPLAILQTLPYNISKRRWQHWTYPTY